jgi:hypothetical protein
VTVSPEWKSATGTPMQARQSLQNYLMAAATNLGQWEKLVADFKTYPDEILGKHRLSR